MKLKTDEDSTSSNSIASGPSISAKKQKREKEEEKMEIIKESEHYNIIQSPTSRVFEIKDDYDFQVFRKGALSRDPRVWRSNETCQNMMADWNANKSRSYSVRFNGSDFYPANMGF